METNSEIKEKIEKDSTEIPIIQYIKKTDEEQVDIYMVIPPDGGWGWMVVMGAFFTFLISDGMMFAFGIFLNDMSESLNCSKSQTAFAGAIMTGFFCLTGPFVSAVVNRFGYRKVAILGSFIASLSCTLTSISSSLYVTYLTHGVIGGIGFGLIYIPAMIAVGFYFEKWRALATGISVCGAGIGGIILPPILNICLNKFGWRSTFQFMAFLSFICAIFGLLYKPLKPSHIIKTNTIPEKESEFEHVIAIDNRQSFFARFHNMSHPTVADIHTKSYATVSEIQAPSRFGEEQTQQPLSTVTILMPHKLSGNTSSEFIMEQTISCSSTSKSSFKSAKLNKMNNSVYSTKVTDSKLSTVYEEAGSRGYLKRFCYCRFCSGCKISFYDGNRWFHKKIPEDNNLNITRPLYRDDIFYSASLLILPEYKKSMQISDSKTPTTSATSKSKPAIEYSMLVTRAITQNEIDETETCTLCTEAMKRTLATMLDFSVLKSPAFLLLTFNAVFISFGYYTPYMFIKDRAIQNGLSENRAFWLISCIGVMNTLGRIACGIISSFPKNRALKLSYISLFLGGFATTISGLSYNTWMQFGYAGVYGLSIASMSVLRTIIIVDLMGLEKLTNAIGIILLFQGAACLVGISFSGFLRDLTGNYEASFYFAGISIGVGSLFLVPVKRISEREKKKAEIDSKLSCV